MQVDSHLDRFMTDLRKRIAARSEGSGAAPDVDRISETIHLALKTRDADASSSKAAPPVPAVPAAGADAAVHSVGVSAPVSVPAARKDVTAMELCKPPGASGAPPAPVCCASHALQGRSLLVPGSMTLDVRSIYSARLPVQCGSPACLSPQH